MKYLSDILNWLLTNHFALKFAERHPKLYKVISDRLSLRDFLGFPLTMIVLISISSILTFNELAEQFENSESMLTLDANLAKYAFDVRVDWLAIFFFYFTKLASFPYVISLALIAIAIAVYLKKYIYIISILITLIGTGATIIIGKNYFERIRPVDYSYYQEYSYSFPSGHSMAAVAFYGMIFYLIIRNNLSHRLFWFVAGIVFILLIGFSRIYLGVHFLTDVLAGYVLGLLWLLLGISIIEWYKIKSKRKLNKQ